MKKSFEIFLLDKMNFTRKRPINQNICFYSLEVISDFFPNKNLSLEINVWLSDSDQNIKHSGGYRSSDTV